MSSVVALHAPSLSLRLAPPAVEELNHALLERLRSLLAAGATDVTVSQAARDRAAAAVSDLPRGGSVGPDDSAAEDPTRAGFNPATYVQNLGFSGALMLAMLDRLQGVQQDLNSQVADIMYRNAVKRLYNGKMGNLNTMLKKAQDTMGDKKETDTLTFTMNKSEVAVGSYQVKNENGSPTLVPSSSDDARCVKYTDNHDGTVTVTASVADVKTAIDKVRCAMDSLTTESETSMVRLQFLENVKNSLVTVLSQTMRAEHDTLMAPIKNTVV